MNRLLSVLTFAVFASTLSACSSLSHKYDEPRAKAVNKVAVLSFEIVQEQPGDSLGLAKFKELKQGKPQDSAELQGMAKQIYTQLLTKIQNKTGWKTVSLTSLAADQAYQKRVTDSTTGLHAVSITGNLDNAIINVPLVMNNVAFRKMTYDEKAKIARDLGANAFAEFVLYEQIDQGMSFGNLVGNAAFAFKGRSNLIVYGMGNPEPLWQIQNVDGPKSAKQDGPSEGRLGRLAKAGEEAADTSISKLVENYGQK